MEKFLPQPADLVPMLSGVGVATLLIAIGYVLQRKGKSGIAAIAIALSFSLAYLLTFINLNDAPFHVANMGELLNPNAEPLLASANSTDRGFCVVVLFGVMAALMGTIESPLRNKPMFRRAVRGLLYFLASCTAARYLLQNFFHLEADAEFFIGFPEWMVIATVLTGFGLLLDEVTRARSPYEVAFVGAVLMGALGQALVMKGAAPYLGQFLGSGAMTLGVAALLAPIGKLKHLPLVIPPLLVGVVAATGMDAMYYALEVPSLCSVLILLSAPVLMLATKLPLIRRVRGAAGVALNVLPAYAVIVLAFFLAIEKPEVVETETDNAPNPYENLDFLPEPKE